MANSKILTPKTKTSDTKDNYHVTGSEVNDKYGQDNVVLQPINAI